MITVTCFYATGDTVTTSINVTFEEAQTYFVGNAFNLGVIDDNLQTCTKIELANKQ